MDQVGLSCPFLRPWKPSAFTSQTARPTVPWFLFELPATVQRHTGRRHVMKAHLSQGRAVTQQQGHSDQLERRFFSSQSGLLQPTAIDHLIPNRQYQNQIIKSKKEWTNLASQTIKSNFVFVTSQSEKWQLIYCRIQGGKVIIEFSSITFFSITYFSFAILIVPWWIQKNWSWSWLINSNSESMSASGSQSGSSNFWKDTNK